MRSRGAAVSPPRLCRRRRTSRPARRARTGLSSVALAVLLGAMLLTAGAGSGAGATDAPDAARSDAERRCASATRPVNRFLDVEDDAVFCPHIAWLAEAGITRGRSDGRFGPGELVRRGQLAAFLHRAAGQPEPPVAVGVPVEDPDGHDPDLRVFVDVPADHVFADAIGWLAATGLASGRPDATFAPDEPVTRGQLAALLYRSAGRPSVPGGDTPDIGPFADVPADHGFATEVTWLAVSGITMGRDDGRFWPSAPLTRGQMAALLWRADQLEQHGEVPGADEPDPWAVDPWAVDPWGRDPVVDPEPAPLTGRLIALDPGHNGGNFDAPHLINRPVDAGGFTKPCNTTGAVAADGYRESRFNLEVALALRDELEQLGAEVALTRTDDLGVGPCIDVRGRFGGEVGADLLLSIHADGAPARAHGFHVIRPGAGRAADPSVVAPSRVLAVAVRDALVDAGFRPANYVGTDGLVVREDLATLNLSPVPAVLLEAGNLGNRDEAALLRDPAVQRELAVALSGAVTRFLEE